MSHRRSLTGTLSEALSLFLAFIPLYSCKSLLDTADNGQKRQIVVVDHPGAAYYLLSSTNATDDNGAMTAQTVTLGNEGATVVKLPVVPGLSPTDLFFVTGDIFLLPQSDLSPHSVPARLSLVIEDGGTLLADRLINLMNQPFGRSFHLFAQIDGKLAAHQPLVMRLALASPGQPGLGALRIQHARIEAHAYRALGRKDLAGNPYGYILLEQKDVYQPEATKLTGDDKPLLELTGLSLKTGDLLVVSHQWELDLASLSGDCAGAWASSWLTIDDAQSALTTVTRNLPSAPRQRLFTGSVTLTATKDGPAALHLRTHLSDAKCTVPVVSGSTHFMVQHFRSLAAPDTYATQGYYLYRFAAGATGAPSALKIRTNPTLADLAAVTTDPLTTDDLISYEASATIATDFDTTSTTASAQILGQGGDPRSAIRLDTMEKGWPRVELDLAGGYTPASPAATAGESFIIKLSTQNLLANPVWVESASLNMFHYRKIPVAEVDGKDASADLLAHLPPAIPLGGVAAPPSALFKEVSTCPLFALSQGAQNIAGGPPEAIPLPLSQFGGALATDASGNETYKTRIRAGQSYSIQGPWTVYGPDEPTPSGYSEDFYDIVVSQPRTALCKAQATKD